MADKEFLGDRRRNQEEEYFQRQEQQLIAKLRQRGQEEVTRQALSERTGVSSPELLLALEALGYTPETAVLLDLVPLLQIAWADGGVSDRERALIIGAARGRGIEAASLADRQLASWFATRPSTAFFENSVRTLAAILRSRPDDQRETNQRDLLEWCRAVAAASGGVLGVGKLSQEEHSVLTRIAEALEPSAQGLRT
jgi:tellurite resistance protein